MTIKKKVDNTLNLKVFDISLLSLCFTISTNKLFDINIDLFYCRKSP